MSFALPSLLSRPVVAFRAAMAAPAAQPANTTLSARRHAFSASPLRIRGLWRLVAVILPAVLALTACGAGGKPLHAFAPSESTPLNVAEGCISRPSERDVWVGMTQPWDNDGEQYLKSVELRLPAGNRHVSFLNDGGPNGTGAFEVEVREGLEGDGRVMTRCRFPISRDGNARYLRFDGDPVHGFSLSTSPSAAAKATIDTGPTLTGPRYFDLRLIGRNGDSADLRHLTSGVNVFSADPAGGADTIITPDPARQEPGAKTFVTTDEDDGLWTHDEPPTRDVVIIPGTVGRLVPDTDRRDIASALRIEEQLVVLRRPGVDELYREPAEGQRVPVE